MTEWQAEAMDILSATAVTATRLGGELEQAGYMVGLFELHRWLEDQIAAGEIVRAGHPATYAVVTGGSAA